MFADQAQNTVVHNFFVRNKQTFLKQQGVSEGADEIPFGKCFPLEYNIDFLQGVDFHKVKWDWNFL